MDPICPLLTLGTDRHAVCDGVDADHRCGVADGPDPVDRSQQLKYCLGPMHVECPHYARHALAASPPHIEGVPLPSADVLLKPTRLVIDPEAGRLTGVRHPAVPRRAQSVLAAAILLVVATGGVATGAFERLVALAGNAGDPVDEVAGVAPTVTPTATARPTPAASPAVRATATSTPQASVAPTATATPESAPTSEVLPAQTYVVQPGDTLKSIADRYGTTVTALQEANGIADQNVITIGQVLTIP